MQNYTENLLKHLRGYKKVIFFVIDGIVANFAIEKQFYKMSRIKGIEILKHFILDGCEVKVATRLCAIAMSEARCLVPEQGCCSIIC